MTRLKGPVFPSFREPPQPNPDGQRHNPNRSIEAGKSWVAHSGIKARLRYLRQQCRPILSSKDPELLAAVERVRLVATKDGITNEAGMLFVLLKAKEISEQMDISVAEAITIMVEQELKTRENQESESKPKVVYEEAVIPPAEKVSNELPEVPGSVL